MPTLPAGFRVAARLATACALALLVAGCLPDSVNPLTPPEQAAEAPELFGLWQATIEDGTLYTHIYRSEGNRLAVVTVEHDGDGSGDTDRYAAHVSEVGGRRFINVQTDAAAATGTMLYSIFGYEVGGGGTLTIGFLSTDLLADAIAAGKLSGNVSEDAFGRSVRLTGSGEEIARLLAETDPATLYERSMTFRRVAP